MEIGAIIPDAPLRASFYPSSTLSPHLREKIEENEKFVNFINIPDTKIDKMIKKSYSPANRGKKMMSIKSFIKKDK